MGDPRIDSLHDVYEEQLGAARYKAERDAAVQELKAVRERNIELWMESGMANELVTCAEQKAERLGKLVWRLQNRLARAHRRERNLRKGMRMWREKAISGPVHTVSAYDLLNEGEREVLRMWPRYEDGEPVRFGDRVKYRRGTCVVESVRLYIGGGVSVYGNDSGKRAVVTEQAFRDPVERADAQVLAADGEPLEVGQTVYHTDTGREYQIHSINDDGKGAFVYNNSLGQDAAGLHLCPVGNLTHQRPVLDADGVPIELGDDLYSVEGGLKLHVSTIDKVNCRIATSAMFALDKWADPSMFTHTKHEIDSLERIADEIDRLREDVAQHLGDYLYDEDGNDSIQFSMECVAKRCRALAYRSE